MFEIEIKLIIKSFKSILISDTQWSNSNNSLVYKKLVETWGKIFKWLI